MPVANAWAQDPSVSASSITDPVVVRPSIAKIALNPAISASERKARVLTPKRGTSAFQTVGVTWKGRKTAPDVTIQVRTRQQGAWGAWQGLDDDAGDDVMATKDVRGGTDPLYVGPSDGVQAKVTAQSGKLPSEMRLELVDAGSSDYDQVAAAVQPAGYGPAQAGRPTIMTRAQWGADESRVKCSPTVTTTVKAVVMHHTAGNNRYAAAQVPSILRGDYAYHLSRGWCDIGYNALVDKYGRIWEGRAGGLDRAVTGAHAGGFNTNTFGVSVIGNYDVTRPTASSVNAVARLFAWKLNQYHRDPNGSTRLTSAGGGTARYPAGRTVTLPVIMGHRNTGYTACPGRYLYPYLPAIRSKVTALMQAALINPSVPKSTAQQGASLTITARSLRRQNWRLDVTAPCNGGAVARVSGNAAAGREIQATWNGRRADGALARPGTYILTLTSSSATGAAKPVARTVLVTPPRQPAQPAATPSGGAGGYVPVAPTRLYNTRSGTNIGLGPAGYARVPVLGQAGIPATGVTSVVLNLTASCSTADTSLTAYPTGRVSARPVSTVPRGVTRSTLVTTRVGADGSITVGNAQGVTELTVDVVGYYSATGSPVQPVDGLRIFDSRDQGGQLKDGQPRSVILPGTVAGIASTQISAVIVDVSAMGPYGAGTLTVNTLPVLTYRRDETIDNLAIVPVTGGQFTLRNTGAATSATIDVRGIVTAQAPGTVTAVKPVLLTDATLAPRTPKKITVTGAKSAVPGDATGVILTLAAIDPGSTTALGAYAWGAPASNAVALRVAKGDTRSNQVLVPIGDAGAISLVSSVGSARVRVDVVGYVR
ncbi:peptidoglycan recognition protein [Kineosporia sp. NBRC 101731]|uniref:peptidoglycan recognition protein family protein n=1 Tax=Kineosporia sp. NBRC 101731 TaxID=3032199 RepID=UPI00255446DA|nr:peptidoglycan recognition protein [Kineosporia sp. NBRC 101731]